MKSKYTRRCEFWAGIFGFLSFACLVGPLVYYCIAALAGGALIIQKATLSASVLVVFFMTLYAAYKRVVLRSRIWILLFTIFICLDNFLVPLLVVGGCQIAEELVFTPLQHHFASLASMNSVADKRGI